nr:Dihydrofolate reductase [uncultured bacterium]
MTTKPAHSNYPLVDVLAIWAESTSTLGDPIMGNTASRTGLPWPSDPEDLRHFATVTDGRLLVMGRGTFEALPARMKTATALAKRPMAVLTTRSEFRVVRKNLLEVNASRVEPGDITKLVGMLAHWSKRVRVAVIGGPTVIERLEPAIDHATVTYISGAYPGDVRAPSTRFLDTFRSEQVLGKTAQGNTIVHYTNAAH